MGAMIWSEALSDRPYSRPDCDPFCAAAQDLNLPLSVGILTGRSGTDVDFFGPDLLLCAPTLHHEVERSIVVFVLGGVCMARRCRSASAGGLGDCEESVRRKSLWDNAQRLYKVTSPSAAEKGKRDDGQQMSRQPQPPCCLPLACGICVAWSDNDSPESTFRHTLARVTPDDVFIKEPSVP
jgi:hypothetical protein